MCYENQKKTSHLCLLVYSKQAEEKSKLARKSETEDLEEKNRDKENLSPD
jgi:hypothetical protein